MLKRILLLCLVGVSVTYLMVPLAVATEVVLNPIADTWLREAGPDDVYDADFVSVWCSPLEGGARYGALSFDISGISEPITNARLELYMVDYWRNTAYEAKQDAYLATPGITDDNSLTWNSYHGGGYSEAPLEGLGVYDLPADNTVMQYYSSTATAADVALLEAQRTAGTASFIFKAREPGSHEEEITEINGRHDWADSVYVPDSLGVTAPPLMIVNGTPIVASVDTWIRENAPETVYEDDWISVWHEDNTGDPLQRYGVLEFDLSSITSPITSAKTALFSIGPGSHNEEAFEQEAFALDTTVPTGDIDWATYDSTAVTETALESLGHYLFDRDTEADMYHESDDASSADLAALEAIRLAGGKLVISLKSIPREVTYMTTVTDNPSSRDWADSESTYTGYGGIDPASHPEIWPRLIINEDIVERTPGDANEDGYVDVTDLGILATNYGASGTWGWGDGDFTGDNAVDVSDLGILATWYGTTPDPQAVPEPSTFAGLLGLCLAGLLAWNRRRSS